MSVQDHYEKLLAEMYTWSLGGFQENLKTNLDFFRGLDLSPAKEAVALDLGAGSGFQSIALAKLGYQVMALDVSDRLLREINENKKGLPIECIHRNLLRFEGVLRHPVDLVVCMGDTPSHLASVDEVHSLVKMVYAQLNPYGRFVITYRDLMNDLTGDDRIVPVRSDENHILTCLLEHEETKVKVTDILYSRKGSKWVLESGSYYKIKIPLKGLSDFSEQTGFNVLKTEQRQGWNTLILGK